MFNHIQQMHTFINDSLTFKITKIHCMTIQILFYLVIKYLNQ